MDTRVLFLQLVRLQGNIYTNQMYGIYAQFSGIFVSGTSIAVTCEVNAEVGCVFRHMCITVGSVG